MGNLLVGMLLEKNDPPPFPVPSNCQQCLRDGGDSGTPAPVVQWADLAGLCCGTQGPALDIIIDAFSSSAYILYSNREKAIRSEGIHIAMLFHGSF